ncbi:hypothetical protein Droror1_Dr00023827 [Drosera rotundifolia]
MSKERRMSKHQLLIHYMNIQSGLYTEIHIQNPKPREIDADIPRCPLWRARELLISGERTKQNRPRTGHKYPFQELFSNQTIRIDEKADPLIRVLRLESPPAMLGVEDMLFSSLDL